MVLLGTATFFEGYDAAINAVVLRDLAISFGVPLERTSTLGGPIVAIGLGAFGALFVTALGDRWGRRPLLIGTTLLYALFTGLTASAQSLLQFTIFQFFARMFLIAELATAITVVAEEFPAARRGRALGVLTAFGALGLPVVALTHFLLGDTRLGWRWLYLIGLLPLVLVAFLRLKLKETERWSQTRKQNETMKRMPLRQVLGSQYRPQFIQVSALFFLTHVALLGALVWWRWFAQEERGFSDQTVTVMLTVGYLLGITGYLVAGFLQDRIGRRRTGAIFLVCGATFGLGVFQSSDASAMLPLLVLAVFFGVGVTPVTNALAAELFPTEMRHRGCVRALGLRHIGRDRRAPSRCRARRSAARNSGERRRQRFTGCPDLPARCSSDPAYARNRTPRIGGNQCLGHHPRTDRRAGLRTCSLHTGRTVHFDRRGIGVGLTRRLAGPDRDLCLRFGDRAAFSCRLLQFQD